MELELELIVCRLKFMFILFVRSKPFPESATRNIIYQVLQGLSYMHKNGKLVPIC